MKLVYFDVSGIAGLGQWELKSNLIASRIHQLGVGRILYGSDGAGGKTFHLAKLGPPFDDCLCPRSSFAPLKPIAPYMKQ